MRGESIGDGGPDIRRGTAAEVAVTPGVNGRDFGRSDLDGDMIEVLGDEDMMPLLLRKHSNARP